MKLSLNNVTYAYRNKYQTVYAVNGINYGFEHGTLYAIVGKSGSGKTTLLSVLTGLDLPTAGDVSYEGRKTSDIDRDKYRRDNVAVIYQGYNLFPLLTAIENVMYPLQLKKVSDKEAMAIAAEKIKEVGLSEEHFKRYPSMLSGGEQQRIAIARALASHADVILADEPTGNLDSQTELEVMSLLKSCVSDFGQTLIMITHDETIAQMADEMIIIEDGKAVRR